jgi:hypothetical protein
MARSVPIITADWLAARVVEGENGCLIWRGYSPRNQPKANLGSRSNNRPVTVRRLVWVSAGNSIHEGHEIGCTCGTDNCVALEHLAQQTKSAKLKGRKRDPLVTAKAMVTMRARSKLPDAAVSEIRLSQEPAKVLAARHGCSQTYIYMLRRSEWRRDLSNPFAGLMR